MQINHNKIERDGICPQGVFKIEHIRDGKVINTFEFHNEVVNVGKNALLDIMFNAGTQITTWYCGLVNNSGFTGFDTANDTMASHSGWTEFTSYSESNRVEWTSGAAASQSITNSTAMTFNITASGTLKGIFITSSNTKSGSTGTLFSEKAFASTVDVNNGDQFKVTYTLSV